MKIDETGIQEIDMARVEELIGHYLSYMSRLLNNESVIPMYMTKEHSESLERVIAELDKRELKNALFHALRFDIGVIEVREN